MRFAPIRIEDAQDPRIAPYRDIRERDLVGRQGLFVAEGKVVLNVLFAARRFSPESALILESRLEGMRATLALAPPGMPVYLASQEVMDRIAGFHVHRGVLAIGRRRAEEPFEEFVDALPRAALVLVLVGISNHDNLGAIFRNAAAFDADAVLLGPGCCDPLYRKAIRVSVGATLKVPFAAAAGDGELAAALERRGFTRLALSPSGREDIAGLEIGADQGVALHLGGEGHGLPAELMARMRTVRIAMSDGFDSLNVAAASAVALHRLWRGG